MRLAGYARYSSGNQRASIELLERLNRSYFVRIYFIKNPRVGRYRLARGLCLHLTA